MRNSALRFISCGIMLLSLLLPIWGNAAMALGMAEGRVLVICTGQGLTSIVIGAGGQPVEIAESDADCVLNHAMDLTPRGPSNPVPALFHPGSATYEPRPIHTLPPALPPRPRAPPA